MQHQVPRKQRPHFVVFAELAHHRQAIVDLGHYIGVGNGRRSLGVVLGEPQHCLFIEKGVHPRCWTGRVEARINLDEFFFPIVEVKLRPETGIGQGRVVRLFKGRHHGADSDLQGAILVGVNEARAEDGAERPLPEK
ncbi:MAG TPA: hypothetical protein VGA72_05605 [Anaerolineales bacterium]